VYPNIPCAPGSTPVIRVARLVAVVDGKEVLNEAVAVRDAIVGMMLAYFSMTSAPKPSTRKRSSRPAGLSLM
jgi:ribosomal protein S19